MLGFGKALGRQPWALVGIGGFAAVVAALVLVLDKPAARDLGFYAWRYASGQAHGGQCVEINGVCIYYETFGAGPPVLVLHGGLASMESMRYQIQALAASHLVIAADSRGHGRSTDSEAPFSYSLMADDMRALLDRLKIDRVDVVGWSDGGVIGLQLAMRYPERVDRLVVIGAEYNAQGFNVALPDPDRAPSAPLRYRLFAPDPAHWPTLFRKDVTRWHTQPQFSMSDLGSIRAPTLVIAGENDVIRREHTDQLAKAIPNAREVIVAGGTHSVHYDQPEIVNATILQFLAPHDAPREPLDGAADSEGATTVRHD